MSSLKTRIDSQAAQDFLVRRFSRKASELERIAGGELSEAFFFEAEGERYVLRVDSRSRSFAKDVHAHRHFSSPLLPIPEVVQRGRFDQRYSFAISRRAPGVTHDTLALADRLRTLPSVFATLDAIHRTDISSTTGYGYWNGNGKAYRRSLASHVDPGRSYGRGRDQLLARPYVDVRPGCRTAARRSRPTDGERIPRRPANPSGGPASEAGQLAQREGGARRLGKKRDVADGGGQLLVGRGAASTDRRGRASVVTTLGRPGRYRARLSGPGVRPASVTVRVVERSG